MIIFQFWLLSAVVIIYAAGFGIENLDNVQDLENNYKFNPNDSRLSLSSQEEINPKPKQYNNNIGVGSDHSSMDLFSHDSELSLTSGDSCESLSILLTNALTYNNPLEAAKYINDGRNLSDHSFLANDLQKKQFFRLQNISYVRQLLIQCSVRPERMAIIFLHLFRKYIDTHQFYGNISETNKSHVTDQYRRQLTKLLENYSDESYIGEKWFEPLAWRMRTNVAQPKVIGAIPFKSIDELNKDRMEMERKNQIALQEFEKQFRIAKGFKYAFFLVMAVMAIANTGVLLGPRIRDIIYPSMANRTEPTGPSRLIGPPIITANLKSSFQSNGFWYIVSIALIYLIVQTIICLCLVIRYRRQRQQIQIAAFQELTSKRSPKNHHHRHNNKKTIKRKRKSRNPPIWTQSKTNSNNQQKSTNIKTTSSNINPICQVPSIALKSPPMNSDMGKQQPLSQQQQPEVQITSFNSFSATRSTKFNQIKTNTNEPGFESFNWYHSPNSTTTATLKAMLPIEISNKINLPHNSLPKQNKQ